ncbi:MAG TPA: delta-60 repeat domain-containing protein, partial [Candidatus Limnocylindrales bacterium]|nr:delta-60 repeat domain-containing protein [Candidatus Limnocylindrales bacterium]
EIFTFQLTGVSSGARLGTNTAAVLLIVDDDHAGMPDPGFGAGADLCEGEFSGWADLYCVALQSDGRVLVGGKIPYFNGQYCSGVLRLLPDGSLDPAFVLTPSVGIEAPVVRQIRLQADGRVVLAVRQSLVPDTCLRLLTNGLPDPSFAPVELNPSYGMSGTAGSLETLLVQDDDKVLIAGSFTSVNNVPRYNLARLNSDGTLDLSFVPPPSRSPYVATESISCLALEPNGRVLVGGNFIVTNSVQCYGLARLNSDGSTDLSFDPGIGIADRNGIARPWSGLVVQALTVQADGRILVSGNFMQVNGNARTNLARLNSDGSVDLSFNPLISCGDMPGLARVWTIVLQPNNKILVGGFFFDVNGQPRYGIARLNPDGVLDASFSAGAVQFSVPTIRALALEPEGDILAVGSFYDLGGLRRCDIARLYGEPSLIPYNGQPWFMSLDRQKAGAVQLYFFAPPARPYTIEATSDFIHWLGLGPAAEVTEGYFQFEDTGPAEASRFYRVLCR